jgi:hypothetical protein
VAQSPKGADPRLQPGNGRSINLVSLVCFGGLAAAVFGSRVLLQEIETAPDMPGYGMIRHVGAIWNGAMRAIGGTLPDRVLHDSVRGVEAKHF